MACEEESLVSDAYTDTIWVVVGLHSIPPLSLICLPLPATDWLLLIVQNLATDSPTSSPSYSVEEFHPCNN